MIAREVNKNTIWHNCRNCTCMNITNLWLIRNCIDHCRRSVNRRTVRGKNAHVTFAVFFFNRQSRTSKALNFLNNLTARSDNTANEFFINDDFQHTWRMWFEVFGRNSDGFFHLADDVQTTRFCL